MQPRRCASWATPAPIGPQHRPCRAATAACDARRLLPVARLSQQQLRLGAAAWQQSYDGCCGCSATMRAHGTVGGAALRLCEEATVVI